MEVTFRAEKQQCGKGYQTNETKGPYLKYSIQGLTVHQTKTATEYLHQFYEKRAQILEVVGLKQFPPFAYFKINMHHMEAHSLEH